MRLINTAFTYVFTSNLVKFDVAVLSLSQVWLFATPCQASLSFTISQSLLKLMCIELVMPSYVTLYCSCPHSFPASGSFSMSPLFTSDGQSIGVSASVFPRNIRGWIPLGVTGLIFLLSKGLSRVFSSTTIWKHQFFGAQLSLWSSSHIHTWLLEKPSFDYVDICQQTDVSVF